MVSVRGVKWSAAKEELLSVMLHIMLGNLSISKHETEFRC